MQRLENMHQPTPCGFGDITCMDLLFLFIDDSILRNHETGSLHKSQLQKTKTNKHHIPSFLCCRIDIACITRNKASTTLAAWKLFLNEVYTKQQQKVAASSLLKLNSLVHTEVQTEALRVNLDPFQGHKISFVNDTTVSYNGTVIGCAENDQNG